MPKLSPAWRGDKWMALIKQIMEEVEGGEYVYAQ